MKGIPYIRLLFNIIVWLKSFHYKFAHFFPLSLHVQLIFIAVLCRQYFCKTFLTLNCNKCSNNVNHRAGSLLPRWWPYQPWAPDDRKQRLFCRNIQILAHCLSRTSQIELLLHHISKGNEPWLPTEPVLTGSLVLMNLYLPTAQEWLLPQKRTTVLTLIWDLQFQLMAYKNCVFSSHIAWVILFKSFKFLLIWVINFF